MIRVALVGCGKSKLAVPAPARELYTSNLFKLGYAFADATSDAVYIVSAFYGLVRPESILNPYERNLKDLGGKAYRDNWGVVVARSLQAELYDRYGGLPASQFEVVLLMGEEYASVLASPLARAGFALDMPLKGLEIGNRMAWLKKAVEEAAPISRGSHTPSPEFLARKAALKELAHAAYVKESREYVPPPTPAWRKKLRKLGPLGTFEGVKAEKSGRPRARGTSRAMPRQIDLFGKAK